MVVKSKKEENHFADLIEVLEVFKAHKVCLNAPKCTFGVGSGKFLGHIVTRRGIKANLDQILAIKQWSD